MTTANQCAPFDWTEYISLVDRALSEDLGGAIDLQNDITSAWTLDKDAQASAHIVARSPGVLAGIELARMTFARLEPTTHFSAIATDGQHVEANQTVVRLQGRATVLLCGERTALNFLQRLSGVASHTRRFVDAIAGTAARITDTRKTTPGWRHLQKWAVVQGGGVNHRIGLHDAVLIKENHAAACGGVAEAVRRARAAAAQSGRSVPIFVEAETLAEVDSLIPLSPQRIMLDNMDNETMRQAVGRIRRASASIEIEATGGYTLETAPGAAQTGVDLISIGSLTHSAPALDLSLLFD